MLELLNQLDGFSSDDKIKVIAATNRIDILDPALLRSGRLDRKIEFPAPTEDARARILQIHSRRMTVSADVNFEELARCTDDLTLFWVDTSSRQNFLNRPPDAIVLRCASVCVRAERGGAGPPKTEK